ncbi:HNH endonuclease signature motif containing protein [Pseudomonas aeruginosa]|uniref:HNH endonuclease signature motif containing protein n=1 Tax=Pseudomonas aeruginosa TaxID=287 RepID=UPI00068B5C0E|nr:HNH endonuclease signature motif containing protein [Pseudomonas aeruginosa]EKW2385960.1 HNH endonuclease [Pseudomonas aeruginosa]MBW6276203.1 HNH endonuclease [Pseudomonas aeruginosa]MCD2789615.1 HNH endonuclease [Pseudomonas aeruginosa]MCD2845925.1 HNH endonuclease [Pseudomonas aeruginosa]MCD2870175.1 HNH endonuclease [Pseudomonas aeruginosa]
MKEQRYRDPKAVHAWNNGEGGRAARKRYAERNKEAIRARLAARLSRSNSVSKAQLIEEVARLLSYDGETGELRYCDAPREMFSTQSAWKRHSTFLVGKPAGSVLESGVCRYLKIQYQRKHLQAHHVAWFISTGQHVQDGWFIDHINGDGLDNRICNLRLVSRQENMRNKRLYRNKTIRIFGVLPIRGQRLRYEVRIGGEAGQERVGIFDDFFEACCARKSAEVRHGYHANHGRLMEDCDPLAVVKSIWPKGRIEQ